jgi:diguanylate cyclase (GGDEF)-like protein
LLINKLIAIHEYLEPRFKAKRVSGNALPHPTDVLQEATSAELTEFNAHNEINRIHFYFQRTRYIFKSSMPLYFFVVFCYVGVARLSQITLWFALTVLMELILFLEIQSFDVEKTALCKAKTSELKVNMLHGIMGLVWSFGGYLLAARGATPIEMQYLHVIFGVALAAFAVPMMVYSLCGLMTYVLTASIFNLYYLMQHYDTLSLWFYGYLGLIATCAHIGYQMNKQVKELIHTSALIDLMSLRLSARNDELHLHANTDVLTGIHNRRYIVDQLEKMYSQSTRYHSACSVLLIDVDYFKKVNDVHGHFVGDDVLVEVAQLLQHALRDSDLIGRYGGEEFLALLPMTNLIEAQVLAERLREQVANSEKIKLKHGFGVTVSIGVAQITERDSQKQLIQRADEALYRAKAAGRNRVELAI